MAPRIKVPADFGKQHINSRVHGNLLLKLKDGEEIRTNSIIMSLNSPVIDHLTTNLFQSTIEVDDFTKSAVDCFVEAMYTGEVEKLEKGIFEDVNKMAHVFDVSWLTKKCLRFYKAEILKFENDSYDEILFACEIASRAHYNLKQSRYVSCFVKNAVFSGISKSFFLQMYMAGFSEIPKHRIDMSLAIAANDLDFIGNYLMTYLSGTLKCKSFDENSLYMLQKLNVQKFNRNFPSEFNELRTFLCIVSKESECAESKTLVEKFVNVGKANIESSSSKEELKEEEVELEEDSEENNHEDFADVGNQTDDIESGLKWTKPVRNLPYSLLPEESAQVVTADDKLGRYIELKYTMNEGYQLLGIKCENTASNIWSYIITGCTINDWNKQFLNDVPPGKLKHWTITKTSTHLKIVCSNVTVLNFNFATDCSPGFENVRQVWTKRCTALNLKTNFGDSFLVKTIGLCP